MSWYSVVEWTKLSIASLLCHVKWSVRDILTIFHIMYIWFFSHWYLACLPRFALANYFMTCHFVDIIFLLIYLPIIWKMVPIFHLLRVSMNVTEIFKYCQLNNLKLLAGKIKNSNGGILINLSTVKYKCIELDISLFIVSRFIISPPSALTKLLEISTSIYLFSNWIAAKTTKAVVSQQWKPDLFRSVSCRSFCFPLHTLSFTIRKTKYLQNTVSSVEKPILGKYCSRYDWDRLFLDKILAKCYPFIYTCMHTFPRFLKLF